MDASKAAKLRQRTLVGGALALVLAGLLSLAYTPAGGKIVFVAGGALALLCVWELAHMGRFAALRPLTALGLAALAAVLDGLGRLREPALGDGLGTLASALLLPAAVALGAEGAIRFATLRGARRERAEAGVAGAFVVLLVAPLALGSHPDDVRRIATLVGLGLGVLGLARRSADLRPSRSLFLFAGLGAWLTFPLPALADVWRLFGPNGLVALVVLSKVGDIAGYYVGSAIGRSHPFPNVSPGKTTAGCVASLMAGTLFGALFVAVGLLPAGGLGLLGGLLAGAVVNLAAQAGDLLESKSKRWAGVKDSGSWFGPSGGVLDLVDSLLLSVPAALAAWPFFFPTV